MIAVHLVAQPFFAGGVINGLGPRRSVTAASRCHPPATNLVPWALLLGGEELHNNHHAFPALGAFRGAALGRSTSAGCGYACSVPWGWRARALGRSAPAIGAPAARPLDADTVNALFTNRMHVLRDYGAAAWVLPVLP